MVEASQRQRGFGRPGFAARDKTMLGGNLSIMEVAPDIGLGNGDVFVVETDGDIPIIHLRRDIEPGTDKAILLAAEDNQSALVSIDFDPERLAEEIAQGVDFGGVFTEEEQESTLGGLVKEPLEERGSPQVDRAEELRQEWGTELGQLWAMGEHRLIVGDCTDKGVVERVMGGEKARYGMHDPPYGINVVGVSAAIGGDKPFGKQTGTISFHNTVKTNEYRPIVGDDKLFDPSLILDYAQDNVLWGANYYADKLKPKKGWIVWDKKGREDWRDNFSDCELAWTSLPIVTKIFRHTWMGMVQEGQREKRIHPTQKPVQLFVKIMSEIFKDDGIIIDFYLGSGTTLIACENLNRRCRGIEIDPGYAAVTLQRFLDHTGVKPELIPNL
jgi:site-specific DNA-methyltransferase (adenine-specific)